MDSQPYPASDKREQEQLEIIRALIEDATRDTTLWVQADSSAEERAHVFAIQTGLADLARIIERRMERRKLPADQWGWSEGVGEVLSRLDKAREARGSIVGKGLARLAEHLPRELQGSKARIVTKAPAPLSTLSGTGGWIRRQPRPSEVPANPPTNFPSDLWLKTCMILTDVVKKFPDRRRQRLELCKYCISEMTPLYCGAVVDGTIKADEVLREDLGGMPDLLRSLLICNDDGPRSGFGDLSNGAYQIYLEARNSEEWRKLTKAIANASEAQGLFKAVADAEMEVFGQTLVAPASLAQSVESKSANATAGSNERESSKQAKKAPRQLALTERRAKAVSKVLRELRTVQPKIDNESHYSKVKREHANYLIFKYAQQDSDVRRWIENVQERRDLVALAQEIAARRFKVSLATIKTDWSHRRKPRRSPK
jgi:hypothetical protein